MAQPSVMEIVIAAKDAFSKTFDKIDEDLKELARTGNSVSGILDNAFRTLNLRSAFDIEKEKTKLIQAFERIKVSGVASADEIKRAQQALKEQLAGLDRELKGNTTGFLSLKGAAGALSGALATVGLGALAKDCIDAALRMTALKSTFDAVSGAGAGKELKFIRDEANRLGMDLMSAVASYGKFAAATKNTSIEGEKARKVFSGVAEAATALHLSADDANGIFLALQQMMSKGKVSAEELNQQLGERLPGALKLAADAMGMTTAELMKQMESGNIMADDLLPRLGELLHLTYGEAAVIAAQEGQQAINRLNNEIMESKAKVGDSLLPAFTTALKGLIPLAGAVASLIAGYRKLTAVAAGAVEFMYNPRIVGMTPSERIKELQNIRDRVVEIWDGIDKEGKAGTENIVQDAMKRAKITIESSKTAAKNETDVTKKTKEEYKERKAVIEEYWSKAMGLVAKGGDEYRTMEEAKKKELLRLEEQYAKKSLDAQRKGEDDKLKDAIKFFKASGDIDRQLSAQYEKKYTDKKRVIEDHYSEELKTVQKGTDTYVLLEKLKNEALLELERKHKEDSKFIELDKIEISLENKRKETKEKIALIKDQVNKEVITEQQGRTKMIELELADAEKSYNAKKQRFDLISGLYDNESEEYKTALAAMSQAHARFANMQTEQRKQSHENEKINLQKSSLDYQLELQKRLDWLHDSERDGLITHRQAARDKLEAEKNYLAQVAELKRRELADAPPGTVAYKQALAEKYEADRAYAEKRQALEDQINADIIAGNEKAAAEAKKAAAEGAAAFRALAEGFYAQWDAITNRVIALGPKVAAAFGVSIKDTALDTVAKLQAKLEEVAVSARKAAEAARDIGLFSSLLGEHAKKAEQLAYRYYTQRLAVTELTGQLKNMGLATDWQLRSAASLVQKMDLLNDSDLEDVRGEIDRLTQSLKEAEEQAEDTVNSLRDELDQMLGNKEAIEERDYQAKKDDLLARLADAQQAGNTAIVNEYKEALRLLDELHKRKLDNIKTEAEAARKAREEAAAESSSSPAIVPGFAGGGRFPGPDSPVDNLLVRVRSGEWAVKNEAVHFWEKNIGRGFMAGINDPLSAAGRQIWERLKARAGAWRDYIYVPTPRMNFATGGAFSDAESLQGGVPAGVTQVVNIYPQRLDEATVRREVLPVMKKAARLKR